MLSFSQIILKPFASKIFSFNRIALDKDPHCPFCQDESRKVIEKFKSVLAIEDKYPVTTGHLLVIPCRHTSDFFSMTNQERADAMKLLGRLKHLLQINDPTIIGFNIGVNCGESAGQTVLHAHIHLIPRRIGDSEDPRGGVRGVIPHKMKY